MGEGERITAKFLEFIEQSTYIKACAVIFDLMSYNFCMTVLTITCNLFPW